MFIIWMQILVRPPLPLPATRTHHKHYIWYKYKLFVWYFMSSYECTYLSDHYFQRDDHHTTNTKPDRDRLYIMQKILSKIEFHSALFTKSETLSSAGESDRRKPESGGFAKFCLCPQFIFAFSNCLYLLSQSVPPSDEFLVNHWKVGWIDQSRWTNIYTVEKWYYRFGRTSTRRLFIDSSLQMNLMFQDWKFLN